MIVDINDSFLWYPSHFVCLPATCLPVSEYSCCSAKENKSIVQKRDEDRKRKKGQKSKDKPLPLMPIKEDC